MYSKAMELPLTPQEEAQLAQVAGHAGQSAEEYLRERLSSLLHDDEQFLRAVDEGIMAADRGEFIEEEEMDALVEKMLRS